MKARFLALAALVLGLASCQTEPEGLNVNVGGEVDTTITVSLPETTRANNSAEGAFENVNLNEYTIRYILQVYYKDEPSQERLVQYTDGKEVTFDVRLVPGRDYNFVVWADLVKGNTFQENVWNNEDGLHYNTTDLHNITLKQTWVAMDETRDAFTGYFNTADGDKRYSAGLPINITLKRPFAKLRVVTTDMVALNNLGIKPTKATVTYSVDHYNAFNALAGNAIGDSKNRTIKHENFVIASYGENVAEGANMTLFTDYFFAEAGDVVKFELDVFDQNGVSIKYNNFNTDIAVQRNYLTTIKGNVLTDGNNVTVKVEDAFENGSNWNPETDEYDVTTISGSDDFYKALNTAGEFIVISDFEIDAPALTRATRSAAEDKGKVTTINLNGKTITVTNKTNAPFATVAAGNTLFLEGGNIVLAEGSTGSFIENKGNVIFSNGTLENESNSATAAVVEGKVIVEENAIVNDDNTTEVEGATAWLADVLANGGTYLFTEDMTSKEIIVVTAEDVVLDGNGFTLKSTATRAINVSGAQNVTIKNLNIVASGERAINIIQNAKNITIDNVTATAANYTVNVAGSAPGAVVAINNSTLNGLCTVNVSSVGAEVTVDGSTVNCNDNNTTEGEAYAALCLNNDAVGSKIIATNSTINVAEGSDSTAGRNGAEDGVVTINGGVEGVVVMNAVINPNNDYYYSFETIAEAVEFAKSGDVISPIRDIELTKPLTIPADKTIVLDLNGKTITATNYAIENLGTLKIEGNGTINGIVYGEKGNTTVENGTFNAPEGGKYVFLNSQGGTLTINGGTINGGSSYPIYSYDENSSLVINDVTVNATFGCVNAYGTKGSVVINGGTYQMTGVQGNTSHIVYFSANVNATINGGTFKKIGDISMSAAGGGGICADGGANLTINGGEFAGDYADVYNYGGTICIKGGSYKFKPNANFVADGYKAIEKNGKYYVVSNDVTVVSTAAEVLSAMKVEGQTVYIVPTADGSAYNLEGKMSLAKGVKLIGMGDTPVALFNDWGSNAFANQAHFTDTYVENINFTNNLIIDAGIVNGDVKFVNCVFGGDRAHQGVHFDSGNGKLTFDGCTFVGRNMLGASIEKVIFNNCTFLNKKSSLTGADKWTGVNMWGKYEFNNCTFDTEAHCNVKCDNVIAAFNNCKYVDGRDIKTIINNSGFDAEITFLSVNYILAK